MRRRPIALVTHSYFDEDPRLRRQAEALVAAGCEVDVLALRRPGEPARATVGRARVWRLDVRRHQGAGPATYLREYLSFFARAATRLLVEQPRRQYALVQVATLPDWLVFAALPLRLAGVPVILDLHEAMPTFFASRFPRLSSGLARTLLDWTERASIRAATHVLAANEALRDRLVGLGVPDAAISVVPNVPALSRFDPAASPGRSFMEDGVLRLVYAGALTPIYDLETVVRALAIVQTRRPELGAVVDLYGRGDTDRALRSLTAQLGLEGSVRFHGRIPVDSVPAALAQADVGLAPAAPSPFTALSFSTKILEYGAMERPVVAARLPLAERLLGPACIELYRPGDPDDLARAVLRVVDEPLERQAHVARMTAAVGTMSWEAEGPRYVALIQRLARPPDG